MKKKGITIIILIILLVFPYGSIFAFGESPNISATNAIVMDVTTGRILYSKNVNEKRPMASTTKIMTALLALEKSNLDKKVKVSKKAVGVEGSSIYLQYDEILTMKDLIYGLMLRSGNDAAVAIASEISGSVEDFADLMNIRAKEIGAVNTNFVNPHGLHHKDHYTTAYDLGLIAREALKNKDFKEIVSTKFWVSDRDGFKYFYNKNKTLREYNGGDGVKIGYTKVAGRCLVSSASRNGMQLVAVVLNAPNWFEDTYRLMDDAFEKYEAVTLIKKDGLIKKVPVQDGKKATVGITSTEDVTIPLTKDEKDRIVMALDTGNNIKAPISRGEKLGRVKIYLDDELIYGIDLISREDILKKDFRDKVLDFLNVKK